MTEHLVHLAEGKPINQDRHDLGQLGFLIQRDGLRQAQDVIDSQDRQVAIAHPIGGDNLGGGGDLGGVPLRKTTVTSAGGVLGSGSSSSLPRPMTWWFVAINAVVPSTRITNPDPVPPLSPALTFTKTAASLIRFTVSAGDSRPTLDEKLGVGGVAIDVGTIAGEGIGGGLGETANVGVEPGVATTGVETSGRGALTGTTLGSSVATVSGGGSGSTLATSVLRPPEFSATTATTSKTPKTPPPAISPIVAEERPSRRGSPARWRPNDGDGGSGSEPSHRRIPARVLVREPAPVEVVPAERARVGLGCPPRSRRPRLAGVGPSVPTVPERVEWSEPRAIQTGIPRRQRRRAFFGLGGRGGHRGVGDLMDVLAGGATNLAAAEHVGQFPVALAVRADHIEGHGIPPRKKGEARGACEDGLMLGGIHRACQGARLTIVVGAAIPRFSTRFFADQGSQGFEMVGNRDQGIFGGLVFQNDISRIAGLSQDADHPGQVGRLFRLAPGRDFGLDLNRYRVRGQFRQVGVRVVPRKLPESRFTPKLGASTAFTIFNN